MKRLAIAFGLATSAAANAQSFNVDLNTSSGAGAGAPSMSFKGAAGQSGFWNVVGAQTNFALAELDSAPSAVTLTRLGSGGIVSNGTAALTGDDEKLLEDAFVGSAPVTYTFNNLQAATYAVYTYAIDPTSWAPSQVNVAGSTSQTNQDVGSFLSGPNYFVGATHALHVVSVTAGGNISVSIASSSVVAGLQLVRLPGSLLRIYVDDSAAGAGNGARWADAFTNPVTALRTAGVAGGQNCEIWVANGFYKPTTGTDRYASFDIPNHLKFYGGFAGNETSLSQRTGTNLCYLNGEIGNASVNSDNCYVVVNADFTAADTLIDGFRIHNGYNDDGSVSGGKGGGMRLLSGSATVRDCTFVDNVAADAGGGVYSYNGAAMFVNCLFYRNEAYSGAAIHHADQFPTDQEPARFYNCRFMSNYAFEGTAKIDDAEAVFMNCIFTGNRAQDLGGAVNGQGNDGYVWIRNSTIAGNSAGRVGGVIAENGSDMMILNSILWANVDDFAADGLTEQVFFNPNDGSLITIDESTVQGYSGADGLDPTFVDGNGPDNVWGNFDDNCRLQAASPCINTGGNFWVPSDVGDLDGDGNTAEDIPVDFEGNARIRESIVDRGAFEFQPTCDLDGDLDGDEDVDLSDLTVLLSNFGTLSGAGEDDGDSDADGDVDLADLTALLSNFGQTCP